MDVNLHCSKFFLQLDAPYSYYFSQDKDGLLNTLHGVRRYYAYVKALLELDFIKVYASLSFMLCQIEPVCTQFEHFAVEQ